MRRFYIVIILIVLGLANITSVLASSNVPSFPSCVDLTKNAGDWSSIRGGNNHIPGQEAPIYGDDDVYFLEGGNFVQCLCPQNSDTGIQTNWWDITGKDVDVDHYKSQGWFFEYGYNWNLVQDHTYLAKNKEYTCRQPQPSPSVTPSPTPSATPTATPTSSPDNHSSQCVLLSASTTSGTEDLTVEFKANGYDTAGYVQEYQFDFGDSSSGPQIVTQTGSSATHRYDNPGNYTARLQVKDSRGAWKTSSKCEVNINVLNRPQVLGTSTVKELPKTGPREVVIFAGTLLSIIGYAVYRRFNNI